MTIDAELSRKFPFHIDLNKILPDLLWHVVFTIYVSKWSKGTVWQ